MINLVMNYRQQQRYRIRRLLRNNNEHEIVLHRFGLIRPGRYARARAAPLRGRPRLGCQRKLNGTREPRRHRISEIRPTLIR